MRSVTVIGAKDKYKGNYINTTSRSNDWSKELSPFFLGPVSMYGDKIAKNMENAWQYSKVYLGHTDPHGNPTEEYFIWMNHGINRDYADRYPMGKGALPMYSYWNGKKLDYIAARKEIYIPLYAKAVVKTTAFRRLQELYSQGDIVLWDFDGYDHKKIGMSYLDVVNCPTKKMGHAFVLAMLLEGEISHQGIIRTSDLDF